MITVLAVLISAGVQLGLIFVSGEVTKGLLPVPDGPFKRLRGFFVWMGSGLFNAVLLTVPPIFVDLLLGFMVEAAGGWSGALDGSTLTLTALGWLYPGWLTWRSGAWVGGLRGASDGGLRGGGNDGGDKTDGDQNGGGNAG